MGTGPPPTPGPSGFVTEKERVSRCTSLGRTCVIPQMGFNTHPAGGANEVMWGQVLGMAGGVQCLKAMTTSGCTPARGLCGW